MSHDLDAPLLSISGVSKWLGDLKIIDTLDLALRPGEFLTLLGPSGCGKTTTLRCVTGTLGVDEGTIHLRGVDVTKVPTHKRNVGQVFQSFALFPHMTVAENVAFPLLLRNRPQDEIERSVGEALQMVQLKNLGGQHPRDLSGGQQQRVGLARAIVYRPDLVLFDEPLSNLDAKLRRDMRHEIRQLQRTLGFAAIYVTHDQEEALALSDRIAVMNRGVIEQVDTPERMYARPDTLFVAEFLGNPNRLEGVIEDIGRGQATIRIRSTLVMASVSGAARKGNRASVIVRPESIRVGTSGSSHPANQLAGKIVSIGFLGERRECQVETDDGLHFNLYLASEQNVAHGDVIDITIPIEECRAYPAA